MKVGLIDVDSKMPNLALMKLSAWHKSQGDTVGWYDPLLSSCDRIYASKVFTFTPDYGYYPEGTIKGGTGYDDGIRNTVSVEVLEGERLQTARSVRLAVDIDSQCPDYDLYPSVFSVGFLTRGCPNKCEWCVVPAKEGDIRASADIDQFLRHDTCVLLDNNVLAHEHGIQQIEKLAKLGVKIDFNQGLDARRIDKTVAALLARCKWIRFIRVACDSQAMKQPVADAVANLGAAGVSPYRIFCYLLVKNVDEAHDRVEFLRDLGVDPFAQPYRDFTNNTKPTKDQMRFARWVNRKAIWKSVKWEDYNR